MSFKERLEALMAKESTKVREEKLRDEQMKAARAEGTRKREAEIEALIEIAREKFDPIFRLVNQTYLDDRGKISLEKHTVTSSIVLRLTWNYSFGSSGMYESTDGEQLELTLDRSLDTEIKGAAKHSPSVKLNLQRDEDWKRKTEDGILLILNTRGACHFGDLRVLLDP